MPIDKLIIVFISDPSKTNCNCSILESSLSVACFQSQHCSTLLTQSTYSVVLTEKSFVRHTLYWIELSANSNWKFYLSCKHSDFQKKKKTKNKPTTPIVTSTCTQCTHYPTCIVRELNRIARFFIVKLIS